MELTDPDEEERRFCICCCKFFICCISSLPSKPLTDLVAWLAVRWQALEVWNCRFDAYHIASKAVLLILRLEVDMLSPLFGLVGVSHATSNKFLRCASLSYSNCTTSDLYLFVDFFWYCWFIVLWMTDWSLRSPLDV